MKKNKKNIHIENSYLTWRPQRMAYQIMDECVTTYGSPFANEVLNRSWIGMYIEWWLHNIGYYVTLHLRAWSFMSEINDRCRCVDLEEH